MVPDAVGGPQPGSGRPPSAIRKAFRKGFDETISVLAEIAKDEGARDSDRIRAIDLMDRYGLGGNGRWRREDVVALMQELGAAVSQRVLDEKTLEALSFGVGGG